jgi:hemoglobin
MKDLETRLDIDALMRAFYDEVLRDPVIGFFFTDVAKLDLDHHLPIIGDFWETVLLGTGDYSRHGRSPMMVHLALNEKAPLEIQHFQRWLDIFIRTMDGMFEGKRATFAKERAQGIAVRFLSAATQANREKAAASSDAERASPAD